jgi:hypothetical protein
MMLTLALLLFLNSGLAGESFCPAAVDLARGSLQCNDNSKLAAGAAACVERLNALERKLGEEAMAVARGGTQSQAGQVQTGAAQYAFSASTLTRLLAVAKTAWKELETYHDYYLPPDEFYTPASGADPFAFADSTACEGGNRRKVKAAQEVLRTKVGVYEARLEESRSFERKLASETDFRSLQHEPVRTEGQGTAPPGKRWRESEISGEMPSP